MHDSHQYQPYSQECVRKYWCILEVLKYLSRNFVTTVSSEDKYFCEVTKVWGRVHWRDFIFWKTWFRLLRNETVENIIDCKTRAVALRDVKIDVSLLSIFYHWLYNVILLLTVKHELLNTILLLTPKREFYYYWLQNTYSVVPGKLLLLTVKHDQTWFLRLKKS